MSKQVTRGDIVIVLVVFLALGCLFTWQIYDHGMRIIALESQLEDLGEIVAGLEQKLEDDVARLDAHQAKCPWTGMGVK